MLAMTLMKKRKSDPVVCIPLICIYEITFTIALSEYSIECGSLLGMLAFILDGDKLLIHIHYQSSHSIM